MLDHKAPLKAGDLLEELPHVQRRLVSLGRKSFQGERVEPEEWEPLVKFLKEADRSEDEIDVVLHLRDEAERGRGLDEDDITVVLDLLNETAQDLRSFIHNRVDAGEPRDEEWAEFEDELFEELTSPETDARDRRMEVVADFISNHPGNYVRKLHRRLLEETSVRVSYTGLLNYINELEDQDEILTVGGPKGHPRFCFPHPSNITDREPYFGGRYPLGGTVEDDVTDHFEPRSTFPDAYIVNRRMNPLILLMPTGLRLERDEEVKGFGVLEHLGRLDDRLSLRNGPPDGINDVLLPESIQRDGDEGLEIPDEFRESLGYIDVATQ